MSQPSRSDLVGLELISAKSSPRRSDLNANKLLCIVGPTASGKTGLAVKLSQLFPSILVSADSRQVYKGMDIVTGKDHPSDQEIFGIDIVSPEEESSVAVWHRAVFPHILQAWENDLLPIIVGGTGLYLRALISGIETMSIPPNQKLRDSLSNHSVQDLQSQLKELDSHKFNQMNHSDQLNPRRLVRAIEIASLTPESPTQSDFTSPDSLFIGLRHNDLEAYKSNLKKRVIARIEQGAIKETKNLLSKHSPELASFSSLGYQHTTRFIEGKITHDQMIKDWTRSELAYSKRQLTWFAKTPDITWFDPHLSTTPSQVASLVKDWYSI